MKASDGGSVEAEDTARIEQLIDHTPVKRLSLTEAQCRVVGAIMEVIEERNLPRMNNLVITALPPQKDLARQANVSRETMSKVIGHMAGAGILQRDGNNLVVRDFARFSRYVW